MNRWLLSAVLLLCALPVAEARLFGRVDLMIRRGKYRVAVQNISQQLTESPDDPELFALLGVAFARVGFPVDALVAFQLSLGSEYYEDQGLEAHADALRAIGKGEEAARLRLERLMGDNVSQVRALQILIGAADDLREAGDLDGTLEMLSRAEALYPRSATVFAVRAELYLDIGDIDAADAALRMGKWAGDSSRISTTEARMLLILGDTTAAHAVLEDARKYQRPTPVLASLRAEVLRQSGDPHAAADLLERNQWKNLESAGLIQARLKAYTDMGDAASVRYWAHLARSRYAENPQVRDGLNYLAASGL